MKSKPIKTAILVLVGGIVIISAVLVWYRFKAWVKVTVYFVNTANELIVPYEIKLPNPKTQPKLAMQHLIRYLTITPTESLVSALPVDVKARSFWFENNTLVIDFNSEFLNPQHWTGSEIAYLRLQALAHSLASVYSVKRVKI
ncbi:MAG: GerMN domain-containing protein, partial [Armatimonadetes bacterium]|nr:GerMN domain-containing protein [Armatimonadota bacterium]